MGRQALALVAGYYESLPELAVFPEVTSEFIRSRLRTDLPVEGEDFEALLRTVKEVAFAGNRHNGHPRFFGYVASPGTAATALADLLASTVNPNVTSWRSAPAATEIERLAVGWIAAILGYPAGAGLLVSGGSMANFCGMAAARDTRGPAGIRLQGLAAGGGGLRIYMSSHAHHSIQKAAGLLGLGEESVRLVPADDRFRLDPRALERAIDEDRSRGERPVAVVATIGTVDTGACDPLEPIAEVARRHDLWLHVDACYGGFAALAPSKRDRFRGIEAADSVALDPHKWLYVPCDCGCVLYKDAAAARRAFGHEADYTRVIGHESEESYAFWDYGPELSRRFRALKVWMMLRHAGTRVLGEAVESNCRCAERVADLVDAAEDLELLSPVELSIFCFRYVPPAQKAALAGAGEERGEQPGEHRREAIERELDALNEKILTAVQREGSSYLSNARINGRFALRGCVLNFRTTEQDMERMLEDVRRAGRALS